MKAALWHAIFGGSWGTVRARVREKSPFDTLLEWRSTRVSLRVMRLWRG